MRCGLAMSCADTRLLSSSIRDAGEGSRRPHAAVNRIRLFSVCYLIAHWEENLLL